MAEQNGADRRRAHWMPIIVTFIGLAVPGLIAWGVTQGQVAAHDDKLRAQDDRLKEVERTYIRERDLTAISSPLNDRLRRIETQLDQLLSRSMRPPSP